MTAASRSLATALWGARFASGLLRGSYTTNRDTTKRSGSSASVRRTEILSREPAGRNRPQNARRDDQGALGLRAGAPAAQGSARARPLRGPLVARPSSPRLDDDDRLRLPPVAGSPKRRRKKNPGRPASADAAGHSKARRGRPGALRPTDDPIAEGEPQHPSR